MKRTVPRSMWGQQDVLLGFVEAVDLVDEEDGGLAAQVAPGAGLVDLGADFGDVGFDAIEGLEAGAGGAGDDAGEGGFTGAGRSVEDQRGEAVGLDRAAEEFSFAEDVLLAGDLVERPRPHPGGERFAVAAGLARRAGRAGGAGVEKIGHAPDVKFQGGSAKCQERQGRLGGARGPPCGVTRGFSCRWRW
jgi:hypothetical protein